MTARTVLISDLLLGSIFSKLTTIVCTTPSTAVGKYDLFILFFKISLLY